MLSGKMCSNSARIARGGVCRESSRVAGEAPSWVVKASRVGGMMVSLLPISCTVLCVAWVSGNCRDQENSRSGLLYVTRAIVLEPSW